jgi:hypothetical protein
MIQELKVGSEIGAGQPFVLGYLEAFIGLERDIQKP